MNAGKITIALLGFLIVRPACASWFESCDIEGRIGNISTPADGEYVFTVNVAKAERAKDHGIESYTDCREHIGERLEAHFTARELPRVPKVGDEIAFSRSAIDGFDKNGAYAGTSINTHLRSLRAGAGTDGG